MAPGARERLLTAAEDLFTAEGVRAVGVDRVCAQAGVSKRSLYQHFGGKDALITAVVQAKGVTRDQEADRGRSARELVLAEFDALEAAALVPGFAGCAYVNVATELRDPAHPASLVARERKTALTLRFEALVREAGAADPASLAQQLSLVYDGAGAYAVVHGGTTPATRQAVHTLLAAHGV